MNKIIKYAGFVAILSVAWSIAISSDYIGTAEANGSTQKVYDDGPIQAFESLKGEPFVEIVSVKRFSAESPDISRVTIKAYAGSLDITDVQILIRSDNFDKEIVSINEIQAHSFSITSVLLKVKDPNSVTTEILNYQIKSNLLQWQFVSNVNQKLIAFLWTFEQVMIHAN